MELFLRISLYWHKLSMKMFMNSLFPGEAFYPAGFSYCPGFLSAKEEEALIEELRKIEVRNMIFQGFEAKRKTASFGFDYSFDKRSLSKGRKILNVFNWLISKVARH